MKYPDTLYTYCTYISLLQWSRRLQGSGWTNIATHRWQLAPDMIRDSNLHQSGISVWPRGDTLKCLLVFALSSHFWVLLYSESKHWNSLQKIICVKDYTFAMDTRQQSSCLIDGDHFSYCIHIDSVSCQILGRVRDRQVGGKTEHSNAKIYESWATFIFWCRKIFKKINPWHTHRRSFLPAYFTTLFGVPLSAGASKRSD